MAVKLIKVPKTPKTAFNKQRPVSNLLKSQIEHLEAAAYGYAATPQKRKRPRNEGQASAYIETLTKQLHPAGAQSLAAAPGPVPAAALPAVRPAKPVRAKTRKRKGASRKRKG